MLSGGAVLFVIHLLLDTSKSTPVESISSSQ